MIMLMPFEKSDFQRLIGWVESPRFLMQWAGPAFTFPLNESQLEKHLVATTGKSPKRLVFKAIDDNTDVVGHIELNHIDYTNGSATISRVLTAPDVRGQGVGEVMVQEITKFAFEELQLHRLDLRVFDFNKRAIACYEKAGFQKEGLLRDVRRFDQEYWNSIVMSMLESEWQNKSTR